MNNTEGNGGFVARQTILQMLLVGLAKFVVWRLSQALNRNVRERRSTNSRVGWLFPSTTPKAHKSPKSQKSIAVILTHPKSSREYMSLEKTVQSSGKR